MPDVADSASDHPESWSCMEQVTLAQAPGLIVSRLTLGEGESVPWHHHTHVSDTFFCMKGPMCIRTSEPETDTVLHPGETLEVPAGRAHTVAGVDGGPCRFLLVQSGGEYDFVGVE